ncbi:GNAT family protein [Chromatiaceae bacterium AAb-1]|jgi:RimJ/RimL family protein N-acetyltransferase|nr:GNAT family protein [Chromatiaceae bacterium AAb-1]
MDLTPYLPFNLLLRPATPADQVFLLQLFTSSRQRFSQMGLPATVVTHLMEQQFRFQQASYQQQAPDARTCIVMLDNIAAGKLTMDIGQYHIRLMDLILLPQWQGKGYGTTLLRALQQLAAKQQKTLMLSVDRENTRAQALYLKQGFTVDSGNDFHFNLCWQPH